MAHTLLYLLGYNAPEDAIVPEGFDWDDVDKKNAALKELTARAAALDDRFPRRPERRYRPRHRQPRQDRPALPAK